MPGSRTSEESLRAPSALSVNNPTAFSTAASSRATSPLPAQRSDPHRTISPSHSRATSPTPKSRHPPTMSRHNSTNTSFSPPQMDGLLSRVLAEEDKYITRLRDQVTDMASELRVRTEALEQAYERVRTADKTTVETHKKYLAEATARTNAEKRFAKMQNENKKAQALVNVLRDQLERARGDVERLETEKADAQSAAGRAQAVARELKQAMKAGGIRDPKMLEGWGSDDWVREREREREHEIAMAAAIEKAYEKGKTEGEASATLKALAAFDKLMENDELNEWDDGAKMSTRNEIKGMPRKPSVDIERAKSPQPKGNWFRRGSSSNGN